MEIKWGKFATASCLLGLVTRGHTICAEIGREKRIQVEGWFKSGSGSCEIKFSFLSLEFLGAAARHGSGFKGAAKGLGNRLDLGIGGFHGLFLEVE